MGAIFVRGFESRERCPVCVLALAVPAFVWGGNWATATVGAVLAVMIGVGIHRPARGLFFALDYLIDPNGEDDAAGDADGDADGRSNGDAAPAPDTGPGGARLRPALVELPVPTPSPRPDAEPQRSPSPSPSPAAPRQPEPGAVPPRR